MPVNSRRKGADFERWIANDLKAHGFVNSRRGQQFSAANGDPDVVGIPGWHLECKAVEALNIRKAMKQSERDAREGEIPCVIHKKNWQGILVTMRYEDWLKERVEERERNHGEIQ